MNLLILSDLHAYTPSSTIKTAPSFLENAPSAVGAGSGVLDSIPSVLEKDGLSVDWILCPGDIADRAEPLAQQFAWQQLELLRQKVGAKAVLGAVGNHDVDSRLVHTDFDPKGTLQALKPNFPLPDAAACDHYWARNYFIHIDESVRVIMLNSSAFHGYHSDEQTDKSKSEYHHGRVSENTILAIEGDIRGSGEYEYNILLLHHHPYHNDAVYPRDNSSMIFGQRLVERLTQATSSGWLIVHGHQHLPQIYYGQGTAHNTVVFSAGSVTARIESPFSSIAPNQFYHVSLPRGSSKPRNWSPCGYVRAWHWEMRRSWQRSTKHMSIAYGTGFGCRGSTATIAQDVLDTIKASKAPFVTVGELYQQVPDLRYLLQESFEDVVKRAVAAGLVYTAGDVPGDGLFRLT